MSTPNHIDISTGREHTSRAKDPAIVQESRKIIRVIKSVFWFLAFVLIVWWIVSFVSQKREEARVAAVAARAKAAAEAKARLETGRPAAAGQTEALVLRFEGQTPCSTRIAWPFRIQRDGKDLQVKWPGVREPVTYSGEGDTVAPPEMKSGETKFVSPDPSNPHVRVRVYERIRVRA